MLFVLLCSHVLSTFFTAAVSVFKFQLKSQNLVNCGGSHFVLKTRPKIHKRSTSRPSVTLRKTGNNGEC